MNQTTDTLRDPADSVLLSLARALAGGQRGNASWPKLDLDDPHQRAFGDYELLSELGRGGMGVVYRARQHSLERDVAIKFIAEWFADGASLERFLAEARAAARLVHPNIVPVHEVGSVEGVHYFSMPLVEGRSLASVLETRMVSAGETIELLLKLCDAMDYAHRLGLLHLDLKPANVLIDSRGEPQIADFGLARHMDDRGGVDAQEVSGTPAFMAPEQILIKQYRLTPATDIYALGAILYRCLVGVSPHGEGSADDVIRRAVAGRIPPPRDVAPNVSRDLDAICMKCLELQPSDRYSRVAQLADDLRRVRDGLPVSVRRAGAIERVQRWLRREPRLAAAAGFAVLALIVGAAATTWQWREAAAQRDLAQAQRDRAAIAGDIGAYLFAYQGERRAADLIGWLRERFPGDEHRQADAITAFAASVEGQKHASAEELLLKVIEVLGGDYRRAVISALQSSADPRRDIYAAMLEWNDRHDAAATDPFVAAIRRAIARQPDDAFVWQVAAVYCVETDGDRECAVPDAAETLVRLAPDNMYHWLLLAMAGGSRQREALHEAAKRTEFDDYLRSNYAAYAKAFEAAAVPVPVLLAQPMGVLAQRQAPEAGIGLLEAARMPTANWRALMEYCGVIFGSVKRIDEETRADCRTIGTRMMRSNGAILSRMIANAIVRHVAKDTPEADEAKELRRRYEYVKAMDDRLTPGQRLSYPSTRLLADFSDAGELVAFQRRIESFGLPGEPPADWRPDDPDSLLTARERFDNVMAKNDAAVRLLHEGRSAEAVAALVANEAATRKLAGTAHAWRVPRFLMALGEARIAHGEFAAAKSNLNEAWATVRAYAPGTKDPRQCARALVDLYTAWARAEPGRGYDARAAEWTRTLADLEAARDD